MHTTLRKRTNVLFCAFWFCAGAVAFGLAESLPVQALGTAFFLGVVAGYLQMRAVRAVPAAFRDASTAMAIRRAMMSSRAGKLSIAVLWANGALLLVWFWPPIALRSAVAFYGCYCAFAFARDVMALPAVWGLGQATPREGA